MLLALSLRDALGKSGSCVASSLELCDDGVVSLGPLPDSVVPGASSPSIDAKCETKYFKLICHIMKMTTLLRAALVTFNMIVIRDLQFTFRTTTKNTQNDKISNTAIHLIDILKNWANIYESPQNATSSRH